MAKEFLILACSQKRRRAEIRNTSNVHLTLGVHSGVKWIRMVSTAADVSNLWTLLHPRGVASLREEVAVSRPEPSQIIDCWIFKNKFTFGAQGNYTKLIGNIWKKKKKADEQGFHKNKKVWQKDCLIKCTCSVDPGEKWFCSGKLHLYLNIVSSNRILFSAQHHRGR